MPIITDKELAAGAQKALNERIARVADHMDVSLADAAKIVAGEPLVPTPEPLVPRVKKDRAAKPEGLVKLK